MTQPLTPELIKKLQAAAKRFGTRLPAGTYSVLLASGVRLSFEAHQVVLPTDGSICAFDKDENIVRVVARGTWLDIQKVGP